MQCFSISLLFLYLVVDTVIIGSATTAENQKRLLVTDPDVISQRFVQLESKQQTMLQEIQQQATKMQSQDKLIAGLQTHIQQQDTLIAGLQTRIQNQDKVIASHQRGGSTYVRWGKSHCPSTAEMVYSGYAAGQHYYHPGYERYGGPANMLCLPKDPELTNGSYTYGGSMLLGTEYEGNDFSYDSVDNDVPCAVCRSASSSSTIMIPARDNCYAGWNLEYRGLLASGHYNQAASSYICVDNDPEYIPGGERNENGHLLYVVNIQCVPLPCPPYHNNHKVNCVVCSK